MVSCTNYKFDVFVAVFNQKLEGTPEKVPWLDSSTGGTLRRHYIDEGSSPVGS